VLKVYEIVGKGMGLSAVIVVVASRKDQARLRANAWAKQNGVPVDSLKFKSIRPMAEKTDVVYAWNGDY
jgi:hypothetical protein